MNLKRKKSDGRVTETNSEVDYFKVFLHDWQNHHFLKKISKMSVLYWMAMSSDAWTHSYKMINKNFAFMTTTPINYQKILTQVFVPIWKHLFEKLILFVAQISFDRDCTTYLTFQIVPTFWRFLSFSALYTMQIFKSEVLYRRKCNFWFIISAFYRWLHNWTDFVLKSFSRKK